MLQTQSLFKVRIFKLEYIIVNKSEKADINLLSCFYKNFYKVFRINHGEHEGTISANLSVEAGGSLSFKFDRKCCKYSKIWQMD